MVESSQLLQISICKETAHEISKKWHFVVQKSSYNYALRKLTNRPFAHKLLDLQTCCEKFEDEWNNDFSLVGLLEK